jgi:NitT/TauT family transport system ATP-binding protein
MGSGSNAGSRPTLLRSRGLRVVFPAKGRNPEVVALDGVDLEVRQGEILVLVGASGCGKTTFLNVVAGFLRPSGGEVTLEGEPIRSIHPDRAMIFQSYALFPWKTVRGNIEFGPKMRGIGREERRRISDRLLTMTGLQDFARAYPKELSGGMLQRVAMGRALANDPKVLLCDEPFAALDAMTRQILQQELLKLVESTGKTVVFITHSIDEALLLGDRIAVLSARPGRVKALIENDLPHPRTSDVQISDRYLEMKRAIWNHVEEEVQASMRLGE